MGRLNQRIKYQLFDYLKDKKCPICFGKIEIFDETYEPNRDSFDYKCSNCYHNGETIVISSFGLKPENSII